MLDNAKAIMKVGRVMTFSSQNHTPTRIDKTKINSMKTIIKNCLVLFCVLIIIGVNCVLIIIVTASEKDLGSIQHKHSATFGLSRVRYVLAYTICIA